MSYSKSSGNNTRNSRLLAYFSPERIAEKFYQSEIMQLDSIYDTFFKYKGDKRSQKEVVGLIMPDAPILVNNLLTRVNYFLGPENMLSTDDSYDFDPDMNEPDINPLFKYNYNFTDVSLESFLVIAPFEPKRFVKRYSSALFNVDGISIWHMYKINNKDVYDNINMRINYVLSKLYVAPDYSDSTESVRAQVAEAYTLASNPDKYMYENYMSSDPASRMRFVDTKNGEYLFFINNLFNEYEFEFMLPYEKFFPITVDRPRLRPRRAAIKAIQQSGKNQKIVVR
jgi:hypothetical protein